MTPVSRFALMATSLLLMAGCGRTALPSSPRALTPAGTSQELAFEPLDYGPVLGIAAGAGTIGGVLAANLSGPRRLKAGAARDHFLGVTAVSGRGETFKSGGRVVKNVTGYDMCKLLAGSFGTLAVMTDVTIKTRAMRKLVLGHCVLAFFFNLIILGLSVNIAASLINT